LKIIERENAILLRQAEIGSDDRCARGACSLFFRKLGAEDGWQVLGTGFVLAFPSLRGRKIDER
jgi:hypothetical protein